MSIINNVYKYIFIHIPKTGGTTLTSGLANFNTPLDIEIGGTKFGEKIAPFYREKYGLAKHSTASKMIEVLGKDVFSNFFSFAFVRDPYQRTLSTYSFLKSWRNWPKSAIIDQFTSISDFIKSDFFLNSGGPDNILLPQYRWVTNEAGEIIVDQVLKLEEFNSKCREILDRIGVPYSDDAPIFKTLNESKKKHEDVEIIRNNQEAKEIILRRYQKDFQLFNYPE